MPFYPVFLDVKNKPCLVVGGGSVSERKVRALVFAGAKVSLLAPLLTKGLKKIVHDRKIRHIPRRYRTGDVKGYFLVISGTDSKKVNEKIHKEAIESGILINVVDNPKLCNFIVPSVVRRGDLEVAISTSGKSPYLSKTVRILLEKNLPEELATFLEIMGRVRNKLLKQGVKNDKKLKIYAELVNSPILLWIKQGSGIKISRFLKELIGEGYTLSELGMRIPS